MRMASSFLVVLLLGAAPPDGAQPAALKFEEVVLVEGSAPNLSLLYVVLTVPRANGRKLDELVVKSAQAALREAAAHKFKGAIRAGELPTHEGNVVFLVREVRGDRWGAVTGFGVEQLREIVKASPERGRQLVGAHSWSLGKLPGKK